MKLDIKSISAVVAFIISTLTYVGANVIDTADRVTTLEAQIKNVVTSERIVRLEEKLESQIVAVNRLTPVVANLDRSLIKLETTLSLMLEQGRK